MIIIPGGLKKTKSIVSLAPALGYLFCLAQVLHKSVIPKRRDILLLLLLFFIEELLSLAYPFVAYYLYRQWYHNTIDDDYAQRCLYGAIALLLFSLLGKFLVKVLLSKNRKAEDEAQMFDPNMRETLKRPGGSIINIEYYGMKHGRPIIFVHGLNANRKNWQYQRQYLKKDYRIILMNLPGMGKYTRPTNKVFSLAKMAVDLQAVIEHRGA